MILTIFFMLGWIVNAVIVGLEIYEDPQDALDPQILLVLLLCCIPFVGLVAKLHAEYVDTNSRWAAPIPWLLVSILIAAVINGSAVAIVHLAGWA